MLTRPRQYFWTGACLTLATFATFAIALWWMSPWSLPVLLVADALCMASIVIWRSHAPIPARALLTRSFGYLLLLAGYTALIGVLLGIPVYQLRHGGSLGAALGVSAAVLIALLALWRIWPAYGLIYRKKARHNGEPENGVLLAAFRAAWRLTECNEIFFGYGLVVAVCLLTLAQGALSLAAIDIPIAGIYRESVLLGYALVVAPLASWAMQWCCARAVLLDYRRERRVRQRSQQVPMVRSTSGDDSIPDGLSRERLNAMLLQCARAGQIQLALAAVERGADPNSVPMMDDRDQRSALVLAAVNPDLRLLRELICRGADLNRSHAGLVPLLAVTRDSHEGRPEAVMTLLTNGARPDCRDTEGNTPLHFAALAAHPTVAALLCDSGAAVDAVNRNGYTPLCTACAAGNWELVRFLLKRGAKPEAERAQPALLAAASVADDDVTGVDLLLKHKVKVNACGLLERSALMTAALHGHATIVARLLDAGANVDDADEHGTTALIEAARAGANVVLDILSAHHPDIDAVDRGGRSALMVACRSERAGEETVRHLLALGASTQLALPDGRRAVDLAAAAGRWAIVALLDPDYPRPAAVAEPDTARSDPSAHLLDALRFAHWEIAESMRASVRAWPQAEHARVFAELLDQTDPAACHWQLAHGMDANATLVDGRTLWTAALERLPLTTATAHAILRGGAQPAGSCHALIRICRAGAGCKNDEQRQVLELLALETLEYGGEMFALDADARSPLANAVGAGFVRLTEALLERGANPNSEDRQGRTPLFEALTLPPTSALPIVRALLYAGANAEVAANNGETPLGLSLTRSVRELRNWLNWSHWKLPGRRLRGSDLVDAAACGDSEAVHRLLAFGLALNATDARGATALIRAAGNGHDRLVSGLLERGADAAKCADTGATALTAAISARQPHVVQALIEHGVAVDQRLPGDVTALMIAAELGYAELTSQLLAHGADADASDERGTRALHAAAHFAFHAADADNALRTLRCLLDAGAKIDAPDGDGRTALLLLLGANARAGVEPDQERLLKLTQGLLDYGPNLGVQDKHGAGALHICAMHGLLLPARALLAAGADPTQRDQRERRPRDIAQLRGFVDIAAVLNAADPVSESDPAWRASSG